MAGPGEPGQQTRFSPKECVSQNMKYHEIFVYNDLRRCRRLTFVNSYTAFSMSLSVFYCMCSCSVIVQCSVFN